MISQHTCIMMRRHGKGAPRRDGDRAVLWRSELAAGPRGKHSTASGGRRIAALQLLRQQLQLPLHLMPAHTHCYARWWAHGLRRPGDILLLSRAVLPIHCPYIEDMPPSDLQF